MPRLRQQYCDSQKGGGGQRGRTWGRKGTLLGTEMTQCADEVLLRCTRETCTMMLFTNINPIKSMKGDIHCNIVCNDKHIKLPSERNDTFDITSV